MSISANSPAGQRLLKKSTLVEEGRRLENNNNVENAIAGLKLRYVGCHNLLQMAEGGGGGEDGSPVENGAVITFELASSCSGGYYGKYACPMQDFMDSYTESMLNEREWRCENFRENYCGYCEGNDNNNGNNNNNGNYNGNGYYSCEQECFMNGYDPDTNENMASCYQEEQQDGQEEFEIQRYLECAGKCSDPCAMCATSVNLSHYILVLRNGTEQQ